MENRYDQVRQTRRQIQTRPLDIEINTFTIASVQFATLTDESGCVRVCGVASGSCCNEYTYFVNHRSGISSTLRPIRILYTDVSTVCAGAGWIICTAEDIRRKNKKHITVKRVVKRTHWRARGNAMTGARACALASKRDERLLPCIVLVAHLHTCATT